MTTEQQTVAQLAADLIAAQDDASQIAERIATIKAQIAAQVEVGTSVTLEEAGGLTVSVREPSRRFNAKKAAALLTPEVLELCRPDGYDAAKLKSFLSPVLLEQVMDPGTGNPIVTVK